MNKLKGILNGKKTYVTAIVGVITAVAAHLTGEMEFADMIKTIWVAVIAIFLRNGLTKETAK